MSISSCFISMARLFNALVARKESAGLYGPLFHSISVCLNKGLGCPIGSVLMGNRDFIRKARRIRKVLEVACGRPVIWRQRAGLYALDNHINRLEEDHTHAQQVADALLQTDYVESLLPVSTQPIVIAAIKTPWKPAQITAMLKETSAGIACIPTKSGWCCTWASPVKWQP